MEVEVLRLLKLRMTYSSKVPTDNGVSSKMAWVEIGKKRVS